VARAARAADPKTMCHWSCCQKPQTTPTTTATADTPPAPADGPTARLCAEHATLHKLLFSIPTPRR